MKKTIWIIIVIAIIRGLIWSFNKKEDKDQYVVRIGYIPIMPSKLPLEIAIQKGFFKEEGVEVEITELQSSNLVSDGLIRGDIDVTPEMSVLPFIAAEISDPGKMKLFQVTDLTVDKPFDSIIVKTNSSIQGLEDLKGKKVGVFSGSTATNMLKLLLKEKGIDASSIQFVQLPPAQQLQALSADSIDALFAYEPSLSISLASKETRKIYGSVFAELVNHNPLGGAFARTTFINEHPEEAKKVISALNKAADFIKTNDEDTRKIAQEAFKLNEEVIKIVSLPYINYSEKIDRSLFNDLLDVFVSGGEIKSKPDIGTIFYK